MHWRDSDSKRSFYAFCRIFRWNTGADHYIASVTQCWSGRLYSFVGHGGHRALYIHRTGWMAPNWLVSFGREYHGNNHAVRHIQRDVAGYRLAERHEYRIFALHLDCESSLRAVWRGQYLLHDLWHMDRRDYRQLRQSAEQLLLHSSFGDAIGRDIAHNDCGQFVCHLCGGCLRRCHSSHGGYDVNRANHAWRKGL